MAQTVKIILEDDVDGGPADETVRFGLDGNLYEIDLSEKNAAALREAITPFVGSARRVKTTAASRTRSSTGASKNSDTPKIRQWAKENNYKVSDRGRIHQEIQDAYYQAHS